MSDLSVERLPWQQQLWVDSTRFQVVAAGRRCGKSRYAAWKLLMDRMLPVAAFEKDVTKGAGKSSIQINITSAGGVSIPDQPLEADFEEVE